MLRPTYLNLFQVDTTTRKSSTQQCFALPKQEALTYQYELKKSHL